MRGVRPGLRRLAIVASLAAGLLAGCSSGPEADASVKAGSGEVTNPGGKPRTPQEAQMASQMQQAGNQMNAQRLKDAAAMREAMQKSGGK